jgi:hypothetical protein
VDGCYSRQMRRCPACHQPAEPLMSKFSGSGRIRGWHNVTASTFLGQVIRGWVSKGLQFPTGLLLQFFWDRVLL